MEKEIVSDQGKAQQSPRRGCVPVRLICSRQKPIQNDNTERGVASNIYWFHSWFNHYQVKDTDAICFHSWISNQYLFVFTVG
jgi:hypothetical protein